MVGECACINTCSSRRRDLTLIKTSVPKKLLVVLSVVAIVAMCLRPAEAAPEHRRHRLHRHNNMAKNRDTELSRTEAHMQDKTTKEQKNTRLLPTDQYILALQKVKHKLANTQDNFDEQRKKLTEPKDYGSGMPEWLPKTNFVDIHDRSVKLANKKDAMRSKRYFSFNIRQLFKSLVVYNELFKTFSKVKVEVPDTQVAIYDVKRQDFFKMTLDDLYSTIADMKDAMNKVKMPIPKVDALKRMRLDKIEMKVNAAKYLKNDEILFRGYGNLLENWNLELNCSKVTRPVKKISQEKCAQYRNNLKEKRNKRKRNKRRKQP